MEGCDRSVDLIVDRVVEPVEQQRDAEYKTDREDRHHEATAPHLKVTECNKPHVPYPHRPIRRSSRPGWNTAHRFAPKVEEVHRIDGHSTRPTPRARIVACLPTACTPVFVQSSRGANSWRPTTWRRRPKKSSQMTFGCGTPRFWRSRARGRACGRWHCSNAPAFSQSRDATRPRISSRTSVRCTRV